MESSSKGFTLISVLIALFMVTVGYIAVVQLMTRAESITNLARQQAIATGLAREGIEIVHMIRDTNWFSAEEGEHTPHWLDRGLCADDSTSYFDTDRRFTVDASTVLNTNNVGDVDEPKLYKTQNGLWLHDNTGVDTGYSRVMSLNCGGKSGDPEVVALTSTVTWTSGGQTREIVLHDRLYNWLP